ncbi:MAG: vWA domain-containing protein, partial [candidate division WOR-3 bacterium]
MRYMLVWIVIIIGFSGLYSEESPIEIRSITIRNGAEVQTLSALDGEFGFNLGCSPYSPLIDIVWCVDNTGSMGGVINQVKINMRAFIDSLARTGMNYALGLVEFWDNVVFPFGYDLTTSASTFQSWINTMSAWGGGDTPEVSLDAIADAIRYMRWRPGARRVIIMVTDAPYHYLGDGTGYSDETMGGVITLAVNNGVTVFVLVPSSLFGTYSPLTSATGGRYYDIWGNYNVIFADIVSGLHSVISTGNIFNTSGRTLYNVYAQIVLGPCLTLLSGANPQNLGQLNPGSGASPSWQFDVGACSGCDGCFWIVAWSGSIRDSVRGCVQYDNCQCTPPSVDIGNLSPPGVISACEYQEITVRIFDNDVGVLPSSIRFAVNGVNYRYPDFTYSSPYLHFTPTTQFTHLQRVEYSVSYVSDICYCEQRTPFSSYFIMDLRAPEIVSWTPNLAGTIVPPDSNITITIAVIDTPAGINASNAYFTVNGRPVTGLTYTGGIYSGTFTGTINLERLGITAGDTVTLCFYREDLVPSVYCGPNEADSCIVFFTNVGPIARIVTPRPDSITACSDQPIIIYIVDNNGIDVRSIIFEINGISYRVGDGLLNFVSDSVLIFQPPIGWWENNQDVHVRLLQARDLYGAPMQNPPLDWHFYVDLQPPVGFGFYPPPGTILFVNPDSIVVTVIDSFSGLDLRSLDFLINGRSYPYSMQVNSDSSVTLRARITSPFCPPEVAGVCNVNVCIPGMDTPDYCSPNDTSICWNFTIIIAGPYGWIVHPMPDSITACDDQPIIIAIRDTLAAIDTNSIELSIGGRIYTINSPYLSFEEDSLLVFRPPRGYFFDGETVHVELLNARNVNGTRMSNLPLVWDFYVDLSPPVYWSPFPTPDSSIADTTPMITINLIDSISGLEYRSVRLTVVSTSDSASFDLLSPALGYSSPQLVLNTLAAGLVFHDNDTVRVCLDSTWDTPDYCDPNRAAPFCWRFFVNYIGPVVRIIEPLPNTYSSCDDQGIFVYIYDASGVDISSIDFIINGVHYRVGDPYVTYTNDTLRFTPPPGYWRNGEVVRVTVDLVQDIWGIRSPDVPLSWQFTIDLHPPDIWGFVPSDLSLVPNERPDIYFYLVDSLSGLDSSRVVFIIEDTIRLRLNSHGVHYSSGRVRIDTEELGIMFSDMETVRVCLDSLWDSPDYCSPNDTAYCWSFVVSLMGPRARIIQYRPNTYVACLYPDQWIAISIEDDDGIDPNTIVLTVEDVTYRFPNPQLDLRHDLLYRHDTLIFRPPVSWVNGQVVDVCLDSVSDRVGNGLGSRLCWRFTMDLQPPFVYGAFPSAGSIVTDSTVVIRFFLYDSLSGILPSSISISVDGVRYMDTLLTGLHIRDAGRDTGYSIWFDPIEAHRYFDDHDTVEVCISAVDRPDYCGPNVLDTCYFFEVRLRGPVPDTLVPWAGAITSCDDQIISVLLVDDDFGVNWESVRLIVNGIEYNYSDGRIYHIGDTLYFDPDSFGLRFANNETIRVQLVYADDSLGNHLQWVLDYVFLVDLEPPRVSGAVPGALDTITTTQPLIRFALTDNLSGVDESYITLTINGRSFTIADSSMRFSGDTIYFSSRVAGLRFSGGDTVLVCVVAQDSPDLCEPNILDTCWVFYISPGGPYPELVRP